MLPGNKSYPICSDHQMPVTVTATRTQIRSFSLRAYIHGKSNMDLSLALSHSHSLCFPAKWKPHSLTSTTSPSSRNRTLQPCVLSFLLAPTCTFPNSIFFVLVIHHSYVSVPEIHKQLYSKTLVLVVVLARTSFQNLLSFACIHIYTVLHTTKV